MCKLFGAILEEPVNLNIYTEKFKECAQENPDGWGIGWYEDEARIYKEAISALAKESKFSEYSRNINSKIMIIHVRKKSRGDITVANSHPFKYKNWIFIHNGTINRDYISPLLNETHLREVKGDTDSEIYFHWIIQNIEMEGNVIDGINKALIRVINSEYTSLNFILSDGVSLYALKYSLPEKEHKYPLYFLDKKKFILVCSIPLTEENWIDIGYKNLFIVKSDLTFERIKLI